MANDYKTKYPKVGSVWQDPETKQFSISLPLVEPVTLKVKSGDRVEVVELVPNAKGYCYLNLQKPEDELKKLVAGGYLTEDVASERKARIPANLKYNVTFSRK